MERNSSRKATTNSMKSRILITSDIYRRLLNKARQSGLTADELAEALINKQLNLKWI